MNQRPLENPINESVVFSVSTLNGLARELLEECFASVTVEGEISNFSVPGSGHWYLTLKDSTAQVRCAMFRNRNMSVRFKPANGMQVTVKGKLSLYEGRGDYQLILESMTDAGAGALQRAYDALKQQLLNEGLFDPAGRLALPTNCRHVAVITSPTGAVIRDILSVFKRRYPAMKVTVLPVPVQGADAVKAICAALAIAEQRSHDLQFDAIILARGGGSLEDLQAFNDEHVARAIHRCALPVVSAIGHETDVTIADFVADLRAPTPTAAAEMVSPDQLVLLKSLHQTEQKLLRIIQSLLNHRKQQLDWLRRRLQHPGRKLQDQAQTLDRLDVRLKRVMQTILFQQKNRLQSLARSLDTVSPLQTLQRGFSMTQTETGKLIDNSAQVTEGDRIMTVLKSGRIVSKVEYIE
ncbi:exodeoxyribonuclease VII large subunit [Gammaproteobacteria bacterium LSUCC0112]|nr:exodeoxyribonuclease VII large subunit [Gammaproteobacteria bacterium LSUCC0112]